MKKYIKASRNDFEYITDEVFENTKYKSIKDAIDRDEVWILSNGDVFYFEHPSTFPIPNGLYDLLIKDVKRIYPGIRFLYDEPSASQLDWMQRRLKRGY